MPSYGSQIETQRIPILGLRPEQSPTAPASPVDGLLWHDTSENRVKLFLGGDWYYIDNQLIESSEFDADYRDGTRDTYSLRRLGFSALMALPGDSTLDEIANPVQDIDLNGHRIINVTDPVDPQDAVTKNYADTLRAGLRVKDAVRVASTENITLSGLQTVDGVTVASGDRVLVKEQTDPAENGIYIAATGAWARAEDANSSDELDDGTATFVQEGDTRANTRWAQINSLTSLADAQNWVQDAALPSYGAGAGLLGTGTRFGNIFDIVAADTTIKVNADSIEVDLVPVDKGGTNARTAYDARKNLNAMGRYAVNLGALTAGAEATVTHGLGSEDVSVNFRRTTSNAVEIIDWRVIDADTIGVTAHIAYTAAALRCVVIG